MILMKDNTTINTSSVMHLPHERFAFSPLWMSSILILSCKYCGCVCVVVDVHAYSHWGYD